MLAQRLASLSVILSSWCSYFWGLNVGRYACCPCSVTHFLSGCIYLHQRNVSFMETYHLSSHWRNTWVFKTDELGSSSSMSTFYMNLCSNVRGTVAETQCSSATSSICLKQENIYTNVGTHNDTITATANEGGGGFRLDYRGGVCSSGASESTAAPEMWQTTIEFKCDKTLVSRGVYC